MLLEPRFEVHRAMLLAGLRQHHKFSEAPADIPAQWERFVALATLPNQIGSTAYGATCSTDLATQVFEYMCAAEVSTFDGLVAGIGRMRVPEQRYAVFTLNGPLSGLQTLWESIWKTWLPASGLRPANTPDFERYDERFDPQTRSGIVEIWFPVAASTRMD